MELLKTQLNDHARLHERANMALNAIDERSRRHELILRGEGNEHGLVVKVDRIEQALIFVKWIGSGGLAGLAATLILLWQILRALAEAKP